MDEPLQVAIIGCGWAGTRHARAFAAGGARPRWAVDLDGGRAAALCREWARTRATADYREALADPLTEAVAICLPHALHAEVAVAAATASKPILCEKPLAGTLADADRPIAAAERAGVILMVAENVRFEPLYGRVRDLLRDGAIGRPALIQVTREAYLTRSFLEERRWFLDAEAAAGGIMMSGGVHDFDLLRMLIGEIESVYALRARQRFHEMEGDDTSVAAVRFRDGAVGTLVESFVMKSLATAGGAEVQRLRIDGDLGSLDVGEGCRIRLFSERPDLLPPGAPMGHEIAVPEADTFRLEVTHFLQAVREGQEPITSGRSQRGALAAVLAAYQSMATGQAVRVALEGEPADGRG